MSLPTRLALAFALVAAVVAGAVGLLSYHSASERVTAEIDRSLQAAATALAGGQNAVLSASIVQVPAGPELPGGPVGPRGPGQGGPGQGGPGPGGPADRRGPDADRTQLMTAQRVAADGSVVRLGGRDVALPVDDDVRALAADATAGRATTTEVRVGRDTYRLLTTSVGNGAGAIQVAADIGESERVLGGTAREIAFLSLAVTVVAAGLGWLLARRIARRLVRLTGIAEQVSVAGVGERTVPVEGRDEVARLSSAFNTMLRRLADARESQERLVQDAAHELRTPLTSLRTNASVLRRIDRLPAPARDRLVDDIDGETRELTRLVEELVELALARHADEPDTVVELAAVAGSAAERARRRHGREVVVDADGSRVRGRRADLQRATGNLVENAAKFDPAGTEPILITVRDGTVSVADRGPGLDPADVDRVFDRFHRADSARSLPGSGLGLAIVRDVAEAHDGTVFAGNRPGGGADIGFTVGPGRVVADDLPG